MSPTYQPFSRLTILIVLTLSLAATSNVESGATSADPNNPFVNAARLDPSAAPANTVRVNNVAPESLSETPNNTDLQSEFDVNATLSDKYDDARRIYRICRVTAYCDRGKTAAGVPSGLGQCAAPGYVPLGALVHIPDLDRTLVVTDRTHRRFRNSTIDIFMPDRSVCKQFGRKFLECEIIVPPATERARLLGYR